MAKKASTKKFKQKNSHQKKHELLTVVERRHLAHKTLAEGDFANAISLLKSILKESHCDDCIELLAQAYAGRAAALAAKGMVEEAITLWRNRHTLCDRPLADPFFLGLLLQRGRHEEALQLFASQQEQLQAQEQLPRSAELIAAQLLATDKASLLKILQQALPEENPVIRDLPHANSALQAYCTGDDEAAARQLSKIPFRSPYRDFRRLLTALLTQAEDPGRALTQLSRIDSDSPFYAFTGLIQLANHSGQPFWSAFSSLEPRGKQFVAALRGWTKKQLECIRELEGKPSPERLMQLLIKYDTILGMAGAKTAARELVRRYPKLQRRYETYFGPLASWELISFQAFRAEGNEDPQQVYSLWQDSAEALQAYRTVDDPRSALAVALLLRHAATYWQRYQPLNRQQLTLLEKCLDYDPDDKATYLQLIRGYRQLRQQKESRRLLQCALERFSDNVELLQEAVETAIGGGAFKKAAGYAARILELDPLNPKVKASLVQAHLSHCRKQIAKQREDLADKELKLAKSWARSSADRGQIRLLEAFAQQDAGNKSDAKTSFTEALQQFDCRFVAQYHLLLEASRLGWTHRRALSAAGEKLPRKPSHTELCALLVELSTTKLDSQTMDAVLQSIRAALLKGANTSELSLHEYERFCELWLRLEQDELRSRYAAMALKRAPGTPIFVYHELDCLDPWDFTDTQMERLESAGEQAHQEGDQRSVLRLSELLSRLMPPDALFYGDDDFDSVEDFDSMHAALPAELLEEMAMMVQVMGVEPTLDLLLQSIAVGMPRGEKALLRKALKEQLQMLLEQQGQDPAPGKRQPKPKPKRKQSLSADASPSATSDENNDPQLDMF